jgi:predicted Zn-dependent protease
MAMKFIDSRILLPTLFAVALGACSSSDTRAPVTAQPAARAELMETAQYLPVRQLNEAGLPVRYEPAPSPYSQIERQVESSAVDAYIEARRAFNDYDFDRAEKLLQTLQGEHPQLSGPLVMRGDIALARGKLEDAARHYEGALDVNPVNFNAWVRLAKAQRMQGQFQLAQNTYAEALQKWPDGAELHWNLGVLYDVYLNMPKKAQAHMEAYQLLSGDNSGEVARWLEEIRERTGLETALAVQGPSDDDEAEDSGSREQASNAVASQSPEE